MNVCSCSTSQLFHGSTDNGIHDVWNAHTPCQIRSQAWHLHPTPRHLGCRMLQRFMNFLSVFQHLQILSVPFMRINCAFPRSISARSGKHQIFHNQVFRHVPADDSLPKHIECAKGSPTDPLLVQPMNVSCHNILGAVTVMC